MFIFAFLIRPSASVYTTNQADRLTGVSYCVRELWAAFLGLSVQISPIHAEPYPRPLRHPRSLEYAYYDANRNSFKQFQERTSRNGTAAPKLLLRIPEVVIAVKRSICCSAGGEVVLHPHNSSKASFLSIQGPSVPCTNF